MRLAEEHERILAGIITYNPGLAMALRKAYRAAETDGPRETETRQKDAYFKAMDAKEQARQYGRLERTGNGRLTPQSHEEMRRLVGLSEAGYGRLVRGFGLSAVDEQLRIAANDVGHGTRIRQAECLLLYRLKNDRYRDEPPEPALEG